MADTNAILTVSSAQQDAWHNSIQVVNGEQLEAISYKITLNGCRRLRVVFPIFTPGDISSIPRQVTLMEKADWDHIDISIAAAAADDVTATRNQLPIGVYEFTIDETYKANEFIFSLKLNKTLVPFTGTATAVCKLQFPRLDRSRTVWVDFPDTVTVVTVQEQHVDPPTIVKFTARRVVVGHNDSTTLEWEVVNATSIELSSNDHSFTPTIDSQKLKGTIQTPILTSTTAFKLVARNAGTETKTATVTIEVFVADVIVPVNSLFDKQKLTGIYKWKDKLYALVLSGTGKNVLLWESDNGTIWSQTNASYSKSPAFNRGSTVLKGDITLPTQTLNVPINFAGSPGVVYDNKLYLVGGSRFDVNFRSNEVYYLDFNNLVDGWHKDKNAPFTPRMGHGCVFFKNEIWVLGGYDDQGTNNDVWTFDGTKWTEISRTNPTMAMKDNRCMHSVIDNNNQLQVYGGFSDIPGIPDRSLSDCYYLNDSGWHKIAPDIHTANYLACTATYHKRQTFIFNVVNAADERLEKVQMIMKMNGIRVMDCVSKARFGIADYILNIQTIEFKDAVWFCVLNNLNPAPNIVLSYFVYVSKDQG